MTNNIGKIYKILRPGTCYSRIIDYKPFNDVLRMKNQVVFNMMEKSGYFCINPFGYGILLETINLSGYNGIHRKIFAMDRHRHDLQRLCVLMLLNNFNVVVFDSEGLELVTE